MTKAKKLHLSLQFPGKLPGISKIKHISAITGQNSTKLETYAPLSLSLKTKPKKITFPCNFPANYLMQFPSKLPGIIKIKHISTITGQNSTKLEI